MKKIRLLFITLFLFLLILPLFAQQDDAFALRRQEIMKEMDGGVAFLFSQSTRERLDKHFYYLTGIKEPGVTLVLIPDRPVQELLFNRTGTWDYAEKSNSAEAYKSDELQRRIFTFVRGMDKAFVPFNALESLSEHNRLVSMIPTLKNVNELIFTMRVHKNENEIDILKQACEVTAQGLNDVYRAIEPGLTEKDLAAIMEYGFARRGSEGSSFLQAASGPNSVNIHFGATDRILKDGDIIVFDVGAYWEEYTADISRTVPVSGRFTKEQREIYEIVLNAQKEGIKCMMPGRNQLDAKKAAEDALIDGLFELGLVLDKESEWQRRFFIQHGFYHFIGLDVHDVWYDYIRDPSEKLYEPGMVMTFEPGLYFPEGRLDSVPRRLGRIVKEEEFKSFADKIRPVYKKYVHIGVRIEDDILITEDGNTILTASVPKEIADIEKMMRDKSPHNRFKF